jgi:hypothetical protein
MPTWVPGPSIVSKSSACPTSDERNLAKASIVERLEGNVLIAGFVLSHQTLLLTGRESIDSGDVVDDELRVVRDILGVANVIRHDVGE